MKSSINKIRLGLLLVVLISGFSQACEACELQQPTITRGLTHGAGPQGPLDWVLVAIMTLITLATLVYSCWYLFKPGEKSDRHIKNTILNF